MRLLKIILFIILSFSLFACSGSSTSTSSFQADLLSFDNQILSSSNYVIYNRAQFDFYDDSGSFSESLVKIDTSLVDYTNEYFYFSIINQLNDYSLTREIKKMDDYYGLFTRGKDGFNNNIFEGVRLNTGQSFDELLLSSGMVKEKNFDPYAYNNVRKLSNSTYTIKISIYELIDSPEFSLLFSELSLAIVDDQEILVTFFFDENNSSLQISFELDKIEVNGKTEKANIRYFSKIDIKTPAHNMDISYRYYRFVLPKTKEDVTYIYESNQNALLLLTEGTNVFAVHVIPGIYRIGNIHFYGNNSIITDEENNTYDVTDIFYVDHETTMYFEISTTYDLAYYDVNVERLPLKNIVEVKDIPLTSGQFIDMMENGYDIAYYEFMSSNVSGYVEFTLLGTNPVAEYWFSSETIGCKVEGTGVCSILVSADELLKIRLDSTVLTSYIFKYEFFPFEIVSSDINNPTEIASLTSGFKLDSSNPYAYISFTITEDGTYNIDPGIIIQFSSLLEATVYDALGNEESTDMEGYYYLAAGDYVIQYYQEFEYTVMQPSVVKVLD